MEAVTGSALVASAGAPKSSDGTAAAIAAPPVVLVSVFGAAGTLQHPFGAEASASDFAGQHPCDAARATGGLMQQAGRPAAITGAIASVTSQAATSWVRFLMTTRPVKIPAPALGGKRSPGTPLVSWENRAMPASWALTPPYFLIFAFLCGVAGFRVGWRLGNRVALPIAQAALGWVAFLLAWSIVGAGWAAVSVLFWALGTTLASIYVFIGHPKETDERVLRAAAYRASMLGWLQTGAGPESRPIQTARQHLREAIWYTAAAVATANLGSIAMGAILLNYMNAYVATLLRAATRTTRVLFLAWNVWSLVRVASYVLIGAAAAAPMLRFSGWRGDTDGTLTLAATGAAGVVLDLVLKLTLSRPCGRLLATGVDLAAAQANRSSEEPLTLHLD